MDVIAVNICIGILASWYTGTLKNVLSLEHI